MYPLVEKMFALQTNTFSICAERIVFCCYMQSDKLSIDRSKVYKINDWKFTTVSLITVTPHFTAGVNCQLTE